MSESKNLYRIGAEGERAALQKNSDMKIPAKIIFDAGDEYKVENRKWQGVPSVAKTKKRIWAAWFSGGKYEPCLENYSIVAYSDDGGDSWTEPYMIIDCDRLDGQRAYDVQLWVDDLGRLWVFWGQDIYSKDAKPSDFDTDGSVLRRDYFLDLQVWAIRCDEPDADIPVWTEPEYLMPGLVRNDPTVLKNGDWLLPAYDTVISERYRYAISKNKGKSFTVLDGPLMIGEKNFDESMFYEKENGEIVFMTRTMTGFIASSVSRDGGESWSETENTSLPNPCTRFYVGRLKNGMLLLVNQPCSTIGYRKEMYASLSDDDGESWKYSLLLDDRGPISYPDVAEDEDGNIYVIYDCQRDNRQCIDRNDPLRSNAAKEVCLAKISTEDIVAGHIVSRESYLGRVISKVNYSSRVLG